jgi:hypothetical protein
VAVQLGVGDSRHGRMIERMFGYGNGPTRLTHLVDSP